MITDSEEARLEALAALDLLDTPPEPEFDDIVMIASAVCRTPVALVSLVDRDRQWFKARVGFEVCETPLDQSVCALAIKGDGEIFTIPDLSKDERTKNNRLVTRDPFIRFYAGVPLRLNDGTKLGTLCVIDSEPRPEGLDRAQAKILQALARQVVAHIEARHVSSRKDELFKRQRQISAHIRSWANTSVMAQEAAKIGTFELNVATGEMRASAEFCRIFDVLPAPSYPTEVFEERFYDPDRHIPSAPADRADGSAASEVEYRIATPSRGIRWIARHAAFERDDDGQVTRMIGTVQDITTSKRAVARVQALLELGDRLRDLDDGEAMAIAAADLMGRAFDATRAGFGIVDIATETAMMQPEWCAPGIASLAGPHKFRDYGTFVNDLKLGKVVVVDDVTTDPRTKDNAPALLDVGIRVLVNVPILDHGRMTLVVFVHHDRPYQWDDEDLLFIKSFGDRIQIALARIQAEAEQTVLNREIGHRLKNTFSMIISLTKQTLKTVPERGPIETLERRLAALSSAHDILLQDSWAAADMEEIVKRIATTLGVEQRFDIAGPSLSLGSRGTLSLSLLLHELLTNAIKYGSLSVPDGRIRVEWSVENNGTEERLRLRWLESGGPPVSEPNTKSFGSKLISMGLIGSGGVVLNYTASGLHADMSASLALMRQVE